MNLLELQRRMATDVTRPLTVDFQMRSEAEDGSSVKEIASGYIKSNDRLSSFDRLEIYNRQYWFRLIGAVTEDYSALQAVVGVGTFEGLVLAYLRENPSTSFTLRDLGGRLPQWLESHPEFAGRRHELALDVARLEWAYVEAFDGPSVEPLGASDFGNLSEDSTLSLQPHVQLLELRYPVDELVLAVHHANPSEDIVSNAVSGVRRKNRIKLPSMRRAETYLAVHRLENTVYYRRLEREAYLLLSALERQTALSNAIDVAFVSSAIPRDEHVDRIQSYFAHAAQMGWFCQRRGD